jgi:AcrR family transcriptional regulator
MQDDEIEAQSRTVTVGRRGPQEHERRAQIVAVADEHFRRYGYGKTTVADIARSIGLSSAYIYKFFDSKQAVGEAVCRICLGTIERELAVIALENKPAIDRLRRFYKSLGAQGVQLLFQERKLHDIVAAAIDGRWSVVKDHNTALLTLIQRIVTDGRDSGEFERKTPMDETCRAILQTMQPFIHPVMLEQNFEDIDENAAAVASLVLRSLAP